LGEQEGQNSFRQVSGHVQIHFTFFRYNDAAEGSEGITMRKRAPIAPFDICIPSAVDSPDWGMGKKDGERPAGGKTRRIIPWVLTIAAVVILAWGLTHLQDSGPDPLLFKADTVKHAQPEKNGAIPWKQNGKNMGMVLLDIRTRQAALAFHVPAPGVYVLAVTKSSTADISGVQPGDHITGLNGEAVNSAEELTAALGGLAYGDTAELTVLRGLNHVTLTLEADPDREQL
jgi:hypothetical protein